MLNTKLNFSHKALALGLGLFVNAISVMEVNAAPRFAKTQGVVTDSKTNLQWQDSYKNNGGKVKSGSFVQAKQYCSNLELADKQDWRLPTRAELLTIVDKSRVDQDQHAIQKSFTKVLTEEGYLSSTEYEEGRESVWIVDYMSGDSVDVALTTTDGYYIRCVRAK